MSTEIDILFNNVKELNKLESVSKEEFSKVIEIWEMIYMNVIVADSKDIQSSLEKYKEKGKAKEGLQILKSIKDDVYLCAKQLNEIRKLKEIIDR